MNLKYDFSGWATRNDLVCADGRTIRHNAFEDCDGKTVPLVWNHQHDEPGNILGHALLENRKDGVYAYCTFNETDAGKAAKMLVQHGDIASLSIYANGLKQTPSKDVTHGVIREVSLVVAGANPGAFIDFVDMAHGEGGEQEMILSAYEPISLFRPDEKPPLVHKAGSEDGKKEDKPKGDGKEEKPEDEKTVQDVVDSMTEEQRTVMYALIAAAMEELDSQKGKGDGGDDDDDDPDKKSDKTKGGNKTMKYNVFENEDTQDTVLSHSDRADILALAKSNSVGSLQTALKIYAEQNELKHGIDNIESLFPEFKDLRPGAPERVTRDQGWVTAVMQKVHKSPISRIRTRQMDTRKDSIRAHGYQKGKRKTLSGNMNVITRTTDPQTVYRTDALHRDDIVDITDFDVVEYQYAVMRENLNEEVATAIMVGDGREADDEMKISEDHIRSIWNDNDLYTIHYDVDIEAARAELNGSKTDMSFGENYIYSEAIITAALYAREKYKGTGTPDFFCTPHLVNVMLLARDMNGRRIYNSKADLAAALNIGELYTAEQFEGLVRMDDEGTKHKLLGLFVNLADYTVGSTKGGEITRFDQFDIDFNQQKYLIETRLSGALTRVYSAIALEEPVAASSGGGSGVGTP
ncbi:Caudovirus prohead protease [Flavonifractor plautii]|uniref:HK97 family phage prohead protease n=1 Tax=Flavonifractor plautii TaxID=292800 RepID=UPI0006C42340|nr:HK97 family phage prohead protease [Flavonifractor plautii]CUP00545.1 Caudovirus prohead protease [Flavonifractor plautii]CUP18129.1 Caudovirus prohead protease [Flavonifractor plautii]SCJ05651.1 Caudovirus prohead protease [uncultured Flavonifractor sp.]